MSSTGTGRSEGAAVFPNPAKHCFNNEVCKCEGDDEDSTVCELGSCKYAPNMKSAFLCRGKKKRWDCKWKPKDLGWHSCEWANAQNIYPGIDYYTDVPLKQPLPETGNKGAVVMTDLDDTVWCSHKDAFGFAGIDKRYKKGTIYPGVINFQLAVARGAGDAAVPPRVIPLSARPGINNSFVQLTMSQTHPACIAFRKAGEAADVKASDGTPWGCDLGRAQYGQLTFSTTNDFRSRTGMTPFDHVGYQKYRHWKNNLKDQHVKTKGTYGIFVGDNGQGDLVAAQMMLKASAKLPSDGGAVRAAFIHDVRKACTSASCRQRWSRLGIYIFKDYVDAASIAYRNGVISKQSCEAICVAARQDALGLKKGPKMSSCACDGAGKRDRVADVVLGVGGRLRRRSPAEAGGRGGRGGRGASGASGGEHQDGRRLLRQTLKLKGGAPRTERAHWWQRRRRPSDGS